MADISIRNGFKLEVDERGSGRPVLVLHGGGGPATIASIVGHLAANGNEVLAPTHPGWEGTVRPEWLTGIDDLAMLYLRLLKDRGWHDVTVVGSSIGGWTAAEMAVRDVGGLIGKLVLINAVGVAIPGESFIDFFGLDARGIAEHAFYEPDKFFVDPSTLPPERVAFNRGNMAALRALAEEPYFHDPKLLRRLGAVHIPTLALWGESDRISPPSYGAAYAAAFPNARFETIARAGHLPHIERPDATFALIDAFTTA